MAELKFGPTSVSPWTYGPMDPWTYARIPVTPLVGVIMGSKSDWDTLRHTDAILSDFDVPHECRIVSAHRTPVEMAGLRAVRRAAAG